MVAVQVDHNPGIVRCSACGYEQYYCFNPMTSVAPFIEDTSDGVLRLDDLGPDPLAVAAAIRPLTGLTSQQALAFIRSGAKDIVRRNHWRIWELQNLKQELDALGAKSTIVRGS